MVKFVVIGALFVAAFALAFAPAGLTRLALDRVEGVNLLEPAGTIWSGQGQIHIQGALLGTLTWDLQAVTLLTGALEYDFTLVGQDLDIIGTARVEPDASYALSATGRVGDALVNTLMAPYDMAISGDVELNQSRVEVDQGVPVAAAGSLSWAGGLVEYVLSGRRSSSRLPAMQAKLGSGPEAIVYERNGNTPLLLAKLQNDGFAKVGMTKQLTVLLGNPWPGSVQANEVVLEVEEKIF